MADQTKDTPVLALVPVAAPTAGAEGAALKPKGNPFQPGHPRYGGRQKGTKNKRTKQAQEMAAAMDADPVKFMLELLVKDSMQVVLTEPVTGKPILDDNGQPQRVWVAIPLDMKLDAAKAVSKFIHPTLAATQVTGKDDGPIETASLNVSAILANPELAKAAQEMALMMLEQEQQQQED